MRCAAESLADRFLLDLPLRALPAPARAELDVRFDALTRAQTDNWLRRDRPGGLSESLRWFDRVRRALG